MLYSDDEEEDEGDNPVYASKPTKRARTGERGAVEDGAVADIDVEGDEEVNVDDDDSLEDTRFLPAEHSDAPSMSKRNAAKKGKPPSRRPKKRQVVLSDEDAAEGDYDDPQDVNVDVDDDEFTPEPAVSKRLGVSKSKNKAGKAAVPEKNITVKDERKLVPSREGSTAATKRGVSADDADDDEYATKVDSAEPAAPPPKKRKLPPMKKNKPSTGTSTPTPAAMPKLPPKPTPNEDKGLDGLALPVSGARKPAATANNADFDLRDKSVYASLFMKVSGMSCMQYCLLTSLIAWWCNPKLWFKPKGERRGKKERAQQDARGRPSQTGSGSGELFLPLVSCSNLKYMVIEGYLRFASFSGEDCAIRTNTSVASRRGRSHVS